MDPDGKFPIVLPIGAILLKSAAISGGLILTTAWAIDKWEQSYDSSKYNPGFEHQKERDRRNKIQ